MSALLENPPLPEAFVAFTGFMRRGEPLSRHTYMRVGGEATLWAEPGTEDELAALLRAVRQAGYPLQVLGAGSNLVASDAGFDGVVLCLGPGFDWKRAESDTLHAGGSVLLPKLTHFALKSNLGNMEWACGIPGTVGGSVWGNAGARGFNGESWESRDAATDLLSLVVFDRTGERRVLQWQDVEFSYRHSSLGEQIVTQATWRLKPLNREQADRHREAVKELLARRRDTQPTNVASAGCIWKNPVVADCHGAGELIERVGLKGFQIGRAAVSTVHANFVVNLGGASGADVRAVIREVEARVLAETGIHLEREVRLLGE